MKNPLDLYLLPVINLKLVMNKLNLTPIVKMVGHISISLVVPVFPVTAAQIKILHLLLPHITLVQTFILAILVQRNHVFLLYVKHKKS